MHDPFGVVEEWQRGDSESAQFGLGCHVIRHLIFNTNHHNHRARPRTVCIIPHRHSVCSYGSVLRTYGGGKVRRRQTRIFTGTRYLWHGSTCISIPIGQLWDNRSYCDSSTYELPSKPCKAEADCVLIGRFMGSAMCRCFEDLFWRHR